MATETAGAGVASSGFRRLYVLFFLSGFPALLYQIVWQRTLFAIYGVNIEAVTVVVSAFMLGLGLGSLAGGEISKRPGLPLLVIFGGIELGIAAYGLISLALFHAVAQSTAGASALVAGALAFLLVVFPTTLMGATLPLLTAHLVRFSRNVGRSVGILYFVNTLGSAVACFVAALFTMRRLGMSGSVRLAAAVNVAVACAVLAMHFTHRRGIATQPPAEDKSLGLVRFPLAMAVAGVAGFISLCYEIIWYRVYAFVTGGSARSFAFVLGAFLAGIAFGSLASRRLCRTMHNSAAVRQIAVLVLAGNLLGFLTVPLIALGVRFMRYEYTLPLIAISAGALGALFPLIAHVSIPADARAGAGLSYLYLANILGSTAGTLLVGFVLMDIWPLRWIAVLLGVLGVAIAPALAPHRAFAFGAVAVAAAAGAASGPLFGGIWAELQFKQSYSPGERFVQVVENRSGVITVDSEDTVYGGGVYDGKLLTQLRETDALLRPYSISFIHPDPKEVLIIGMAGGAWAQVVANHPQVEHVAIVEINPGYLEVIRKYPEIAPVLRNPKVELHIDDGRRWLLRHPERRFDLVLMDTTYHWRAHATNLLSREFLELIRLHLKPGGIHYWNTTHSPEAQKTGAEVFPYVLRFGPFVAGSDWPIRTDVDRWRRILLGYRIGGDPVIDPDDRDDRARLEEVLAYAATLDRPGYDPTWMESGDSIRRRTRAARIITEDNMASEWGR